MERGWNFAKIAIFGFCFIFCAIALGLVFGAVTKFQDGETTNASLMFVAGLAFGGFGMGVFALTNMGMRAKAREENLRATHPDEPWRWRDDWATGRVRSMGKSAAWFFWGFALLWNLISTPLLFFLPEEIFEKGNYAALLGLLFPLVGVGLLVVAVRKTIQIRKYGNCLFLMEHVPGILGGELRGAIQLPRGLPGVGTLTVRLSCIQTERRGSGDNASTHEEVLWQTEQSDVGLSPAGQGAAVSATVKFRVPYDAKPSGKIDENSSVSWKLEAHAAVPGVDFDTAFEIPVFKTGESSPRITEERVRSEELSAHAPVITPSDIALAAVVSRDGGGREFIIRPHRGLGGMIAAIVIVLILAGIAALLAYAGAPIIFPLVFGLFTLIIGFVVIFGVYGESRIIVEEGHISVRNSLLGVMMGRRMPCSTITKISVTGTGGYYSLTLTQEDGKSTSPLQSLRDRQHAEWLAEEVRKAMEPWRNNKLRI